MPEQLQASAVNPYEVSAPPAEVLRSDVPEVSFQQFEQTGKQLPDKIIMDVMNDQLRSVPGEQPRFVKSYLDQLKGDTSDDEYLGSPDKVVGFRNELADFVAENLKIATSTSLDPQKKALIDGKLQAFTQKIESDKAHVNQYLAGMYEGAQAPIPRGQLGFNGLTVDTKNGKIDLLSKKLPGVRANITMQREATGNFVHYASQSYLEQRSSGTKPELGKRIYLNPKVESSVGIFTEVVQAAEAAGISMKGKILDRTGEAIAKHNEKPGEYTMRGDGIVLYAGEDADALLGLVEAIYKDNPDAFSGRHTSRVPLKIAEGVAIGDEPAVLNEDGEAQSLTSHRAGLIEQASGVAKHRLGIQPSQVVAQGQEQQAIAAFRQAFEEIAISEGVDPQNLAFNLPKAA